MRAELDKLPPLPRMVDKINVGERSIYLDTVATLARRGYSRLFAHDGGLTQGMLFLLVDLGAKEAIDWDHVLRIGNSWYDQVADAYGRPTRAERMTALDKTERDRRRRLDTSAKVMKSPGVWMPAGMRCAASERCGQVLLSIIPPRVQACADAEDRRTMQFNLTRLAFALAAYHADRGTYPVRLADLTPHYLAEVPRDIFNDSELHYRQEAGGYLLYSVGINGRDDGGKGYDDEQKATENVKNGEAYTWEGWDDISVCVPAATEQKP